jgi:hypothetical protein
MRRPPLIAVAITWSVFAGPAGGSATAAAKERIAVLVLGASAGDAELADNVTEVVIAYIAEQGTFETVGTPEARRRLAAMGGAAGLACAGQADCLARAAVKLGARRGVVGTVTTEGRQFLLDLALADLESAHEEARATRAVETDVDRLVAAAQEIIAALFAAKRQVGGNLAQSAPPQRAGDQTRFLLAPVAPRATAPSRHDVASHLRRYAFYGSGIASLSALTVGLVFGGIAQQPIVGGPRVNAQKEFEDRRGLGLAADIALVSSAALATLSAYLFVRHRNEIFGPDQPAD